MISIFGLKTRGRLLFVSISVFIIGVFALLVTFGTALAQPPLLPSSVQQVDEQEQRSGQGDEAGDPNAVDGLGAQRLAIVDDEKFLAALRGTIQEELNRHVQDGLLSQDQADGMLKYMQGMPPDQLLEMLGGPLPSYAIDDEEDEGSCDGGAPAGQVF